MSRRKINLFQKPSMPSIVCPKCGHCFPLPEVARPVIKRPSCEPRCIECKQPIAGEQLSFGGGFACEPCVVAYYQPQGLDIVAEEVRNRRLQAARKAAEVTDAD
jgi:hypothetical protein